MRNRKAYPSKELDFSRTNKHGRAVCRNQNLGMDLRDYFAAKAIQGLLVNDNITPIEKLTISAYETADLMMEQREK